MAVVNDRPPWRDFTYSAQTFLLIENAPVFFRSEAVSGGKVMLLFPHGTFSLFVSLRLRIKTGLTP